MYPKILTIYRFNYWCKTNFKNRLVISRYQGKNICIKLLIPILLISIIVIIWIKFLLEQ